MAADEVKLREKARQEAAQRATRQRIAAATSGDPAYARQVAQDWAAVVAYLEERRDGD